MVRSNGPSQTLRYRLWPPFRCYWCVQCARYLSFVLVFTSSRVVFVPNTGRTIQWEMQRYSTPSPIAYFELDNYQISYFRDLPDAPYNMWQYYFHVYDIALCECIAVLTQTFSDLRMYSNLLMICRLGRFCLESRKKLHRDVYRVISSFKKCTAVHSTRVCVFMKQVRRTEIENECYGQ